MMTDSQSLPSSLSAGATLPPTLQLGPCGEPCEHPCDEHAASQAANAALERETLLTRWMKAGLFNTIDLCFDDVYREPKRILIVGGCRQIALSQHLALLLPAAEITLVDADEAIVEQAKEAICCRFKFIAAPLEALPFGDDAFDLTIAHHLPAYPTDWKRALSELGRVTERNLLVSLQRPWLWNFAQRLGVFKKALQTLGVQDTPARFPEKAEWLTHLHLYTRIKTHFSLFPWTVYMTEMRPVKEERCILPGTAAS